MPQVRIELTTYRFQGECSTSELQGRNFGWQTWARTRDPRINSPLLYRLSYMPIISMTVLYIIYIAQSSYFIKYSMITADEALNALYEIAKGNYTESKSYSCMKSFTPSFPVKDKPPFVLDGMPRQIGGNKKT